MVEVEEVSVSDGVGVGKGREYRGRLLAGAS